jgi:hypothetical protein
MLAVLAAEADAAEASYRPVGKVYGLKVQAGKDTSTPYARKVARVILSNSCDGVSTFRVRSPVNGKSYRLRCLTIVRRGYAAPLEGGDVGESAGPPRLGCEPHPGNSLVGRESELARTLALTAVFGRESELALAESFREAAGERFGVLGFEGEAGIGKTTASGAVARRPGSVDSACSSAGLRRRSRSLRCAPSATCSSPARARLLPHYRSRSGGRLTSRCCGASRAGGRSRFRSASTLSWSAAVDRSG